MSLSKKHQENSVKGKGEWIFQLLYCPSTKCTQYTHARTPARPGLNKNVSLCWPCTQTDSIKRTA